MRIDLPQCNFKNCRYSADGNCTNKARKELCEFDKYKSLLEKSAEEIENCYGRETELTQEIRGVI